MPGSINSVLLKSTAVAALCGLLFGFDTAVISGTTSALRSVFQLTPNLLGITVSSALWGTVAGSLLSSIPGERWGRRDSLRVLGVLYFLSALGCALAWNWPALLIFRIIGGLGIGGSSVLAPMYIAEIAPAKLRGRLVGFFQFNVVLGILVAYLSNYILGSLRLGQAEWRWDLGVAAIPAALFFMFLAGIPRSPRWLAKVQRLEEARSVLAQIGEPDPDAELADIVRSIDAEHGHANEPLFSRKYALPIFLAVATGLFNQLSGINAILYYLNDIFERAGFSKVSGDLQAVAVGATNLLFTMLAISVIDRFGRKFLLLVGSVGTSLSLAGVAVIFFKHRQLHCVLRVFARSRDLGLHWRSLPEPRPRQGTEPGIVFSLVRQCNRVLALSPDGRVLRRMAVCVLLHHDGTAVLCSSCGLSRNPRSDA